MTGLILLLRPATYLRMLVWTTQRNMIGMFKVTIEFDIELGEVGFPHLAVDLKSKFGIED